MAEVLVLPPVLCQTSPRRLDRLAAGNTALRFARPVPRALAATSAELRGVSASDGRLESQFLAECGHVSHGLIWVTPVERLQSPMEYTHSSADRFTFRLPHGAVTVENARAAGDLWPTKSSSSSAGRATQAVQKAAPLLDYLARDPGCAPPHRVSFVGRLRRGDRRGRGRGGHAPPWPPRLRSGAMAPPGGPPPRS